MTYVVSDLHGALEKFRRLLSEISFGEEDLMYVLGDVTDYGEDSVELLCDLSMRANVIPILGDHDYTAYRCLSDLDKMLSGGDRDPEALGRIAEWMNDGGAPTVQGFKELDDDMREGVLDYLSDFSLYEEVEAGGKQYLLLHAGIAGFDPDTPLDDYMPEDFIREPLDPEHPYFDDVTTVAGHVPTYEIEGAERGRIYHGEGCILMDCGAAFDEPLACLRLEDGKEFYIS